MSRTNSQYGNWLLTTLPGFSTDILHISSELFQIELRVFQTLILWTLCIPKPCASFEQKSLAFSVPEFLVQMVQVHKKKHSPGKAYSKRGKRQYLLQGHVGLLALALRLEKVFVALLVGEAFWRSVSRYT